MDGHRTGGENVTAPLGSTAADGAAVHIEGLGYIDITAPVMGLKG